MNKSELLAAIEREWEALQSAIDGLSEDQMTRAPVAGDWTIKDVLAHLAVCESLLVTDLYKIERGLTPNVNLTDAQIDESNAQFYAEQRDRPLERVLEDLYSVHLALLNRLESVPDARLSNPRKFSWLRGQPLSAFVLEDSAEHYREHTAEIVAWRQSQRGPD